MDDGRAKEPLPPGASSPPWRTPVPRRRRATRTQLDRDLITRVALEIVDREGVDSLSLRRLADALDVTPMSLYWHVADKAELLELVGERVLDEIELPVRAGDWRSQLRDIHLAMFEAFLRHPNTTEILAGRARYGSAGIAAFERILATLLEAGFTAQAAFDAYEALYLFTLGFMATANRTPEFLEVQRQGVVYMASLPHGQYPSIGAVVPVIGARSLDERLRLGLDVVVDGIAGRLGMERSVR
jgi:AcrR family transcriptional regulator